MSRWLTKRGPRRSTAPATTAAAPHPGAEDEVAGAVVPDGSRLPEMVSNLLGPLDTGTRVVVISRTGCHLCHEAINVVARACPPGGWVDLDVDDHPELVERYSDHVPVVFVDGRLLSYWTLEAAQLQHALGSADWSSPPGL